MAYPQARGRSLACQGPHWTLGSGDADAEGRGTDHGLSYQSSVVTLIGGGIRMYGCLQHRQPPHLLREYPLSSRRRRQPHGPEPGSQQPVRDVGAWRL